MDDIERRAWELLSAEMGKHVFIMGRRSGFTFMRDAAMRAIIAAQTPPEGYVLVPVEPTDDMIWAPADVEVGYPMWAGSRDGCTADEAKAIWTAMLAARPEVK